MSDQVSVDRGTLVKLLVQIENALKDVQDLKRKIQAG